MHGLRTKPVLSVCVVAALHCIACPSPFLVYLPARGRSRSSHMAGRGHTDRPTDRSRSRTTRAISATGFDRVPCMLLPGAGSLRCPDLKQTDLSSSCGGRATSCMQWRSSGALDFLQNKRNLHALPLVRFMAMHLECMHPCMDGMLALSTPPDACTAGWGSESALLGVRGSHRRIGGGVETCAPHRGRPGQFLRPVGEW